MIDFLNNNKKKLILERGVFSIMTKKYLDENRTITGIEEGEKWLTVNWSDNSKSEFPYILLKDCHISKFHPQTQERVIKTYELDINVRPTKCELIDDAVVTHWEDEEEPLIFTPLWLEQYGKVNETSRRMGLKKTFWTGDEYVRPTIDYKDFCNDEQKLYEFMLKVVEYGVAIIENAPTDESVLMESVNVIGQTRPTHFGEDFKVISKPNPENLAYTSLPLTLHTDLAHLNPLPNFQFLHCCANDAEGGESIYADVVRCAMDFREEYPEEFKILCKVKLPRRYSDDVRYMVRYHPIIQLDDDGEIVSAAQSVHLTYILDLPPEETIAFYDANIKWGKHLSQKKYEINFRMKAGEIAVFDNRRVMHGRAEFFPNTGFRHLQGTYICEDEFYSRLNLATRKIKGIDWNDYQTQNDEYKAKIV